MIIIVSREKTLLFIFVSFLLISIIYYCELQCSGIEVSGWLIRRNLVYLPYGHSFESTIS